MCVDRGPPPARDWLSGRRVGPGRLRAGSDERQEDLAELLGYVSEVIADKGSEDPCEGRRLARTPFIWPSYKRLWAFSSWIHVHARWETEGEAHIGGEARNSRYLDDEGADPVTKLSGPGTNFDLALVTMRKRIPCTCR